MKQKPPKKASEILHERYVAGNPEAIATLEEERSNARIGVRIYALRKESGLTQRELAKRVGTTASVICRLENADYEGHSLAMLERIAAAVGKRVEIRFVKSRARVQG